MLSGVLVLQLASCGRGATAPGPAPASTVAVSATATSRPAPPTGTGTPAAATSIPLAPSPSETPSPVPATETPTPEPEAAPALSAVYYPFVDGSTSALPLQVLLACKILGVPCVWQEGWPLDATRRLAPELSFTDAPQSVERINSIWHSGTHQAYMNLIEGMAEFILVARLPSDDENQAAELSGVVLDVQPVALDAFVLLVNRGNPVDDLALETIRDIYTGEIRHWSELGPGIGQRFDAEEEIHTYQRNRNSGSQELMEKLVMRGAAMTPAPDMLLDSMSGPINALSDDPLGIGYSVYYYAVFILPSEDIKLIGVDGVVPTSDTIADGSYPLTTEVYVVTRGGRPQDHTAVLLRDWLLTLAGQAVVRESGYVPIRQ